MPDVWKEWRLSKLAEGELHVPLGASRLKLDSVRNLLDEFFTQESRQLRAGYGPFLYEAADGCEASVKGGKLILSGSNSGNGQDQRLYLLSRRLTGREKWPDRVAVRAKLGGTAGNSGGWHVGVSVGRVKILFHPGYRTGGFRAETVDTHEHFFPTQAIGFLPATDMMHEMVIQVTKTDKGAKFDVTLQNGDNATEKYTHAFSVNNDQLGGFNKIGLERSGRRGADAIFDSIEIKLQR